MSCMGGLSAQWLRLKVKPKSLRLTTLVCVSQRLDCVSLRLRTSSLRLPSLDCVSQRLVCFPLRPVCVTSRLVCVSLHRASFVSQVGYATRNSAESWLSPIVKMSVTWLLCKVASKRKQDNATAAKIASGTCAVKLSKSIDMRYHLLRQRCVEFHDFYLVWDAERSITQSIADFLTKPHHAVNGVS